MISLSLFRSLFCLVFCSNIVAAMLRLPSNQRKPPFFPPLQIRCVGPYVLKLIFVGNFMEICYFLNFCNYYEVLM